ncbi:MAG TPA: alpha/beta family hydrolase [Longimicrobiales bacterium]|nr:alpha/beta family hydrolase [Longimicrobiales bacterium]
MSPPPGLLLRPPDAFALLVLAHGAGAGMRHPFMEGVARALGREGVATLRYEFPYMAEGRKRPDRPSVLVPAVRAAVEEGRRRVPDLPLFAGGKSMGGRMTSTAAAEGLGHESSEGRPVRGLVFLGFPLHPAGKPGTGRADHLSMVPLPMLFLQGDRDKLAELPLLAPVVEALGPRAGLHVVQGADHGFHVLKRSGRTDAEVLEELSRVAAAWMGERVR